jgi:hypothetical protein
VQAGRRRVVGVVVGVEVVLAESHKSAIKAD